ncbi:TPA: hypothetical protein ACGQ50_000805 [Enterobacter cloacae]
MKKLLIATLFISAFSSLSAAAVEIDPEIQAYAEQSFAEARAAENDPNNVHSQTFWKNKLGHCMPALEQATQATAKMLVEMGAGNVPTKWISQHGAAYMQACEAGRIAGESRDQSNYGAMVEETQEAAKNVQTVRDALHASFVYGEVIAFREAYKAAAGVYPTTR